MQDITITLIQAELIWTDKTANLRRFSEKLQHIPGPTDIIVLPEMFSTGFVTDPEPHAEQMNGLTMQWLQEQSSLYQAAIVCSLIIKEKEKYFNRLIWMHPGGEYNYYDKRHLFSYGNEHLRFARGEKQLVVHYKGWDFMPLICYDLRFPVWSMNHFNEGNYQYDCLIYVANWPDPRRNAWSNLLVGRAIENMAYVVGVNRVGKDGKGLVYAGDSAVYSPRGNALALTESYIESSVSVQLPYEELSQYRKQFAFGQDWDRFEILMND